MKFLALILLLTFMACASKDSTKSSRHQEFTLKDGISKFCFIGDMGDGSLIQADVARLLKEENCHSIHMVGDLVYPNGILSVDDPQLENKFLRYYLPLTQVGHAPRLNLIMGNHDHRGRVEAWHKLSSQNPFINFPSPYYLQNWSGLCLIHLESNYFKLLKNFWDAQQEIGWVRDLEPYLDSQCATTVALTHHPYKSRGPKHFNATGWMKDFHESNIIGKYDFLISGHEHILSDEGTVHGTRLLISGAGGRKEAKEDAGFLVLEVTVSKGSISQVDYQFRRLNALP